jgi:hypothetical protein
MPRAFRGVEMQMPNANKNPSATKRGPGRFHESGHKKATPPKQRSAGLWLGLHTNPEKNARRELKRSLGARKVRVMTKLARQANRVPA